jgi:hypothetical protein
MSISLKEAKYSPFYPRASPQRKEKVILRCNLNVLLPENMNMISKNKMMFLIPSPWKMCATLSMSAYAGTQWW